MSTPTAELRRGADAASAAPSVEFRPDIQGLRAIAVLLVVAYHADVGGFDGGFIGVDVFFVVSGFLITLLLVGERERNGRLDIARFYARRLRRLLPLSVIVVIATLLAGRLTLSALDFKELRTDALGAMLFGGNVRFAHQGIDYLAADQVPSALEHYWSLGVEEQFYVVWPLIVLVLVGRRLWVVAGSIAAASFAASVLLTGSWAFYGPHVRAWQFLAGAGLALAWPTISRCPVQVRTALGACGVALLALTLLVVDGQAAWPTWRAMLPTVATVALLAGSPSAGVGRILARRMWTWVGDRSYGLYLVHLPPLVLVPVWLERSLRPYELVAVVAGSIVVADVLHRHVEVPVRYRAQLVRSDATSIAFGFSLTAVGLVVIAAVTPPGTTGTGVAAPVDLAAPATIVARADDSEPAPSVADAMKELRQRIDKAGTIELVPGNLTPRLDDARGDRPRIYDDGCHLNIEAVDPVGCVFGDPDATTTWYLVGDSHAAQWFPALESIARGQGVRLVTHTKSGCAPIRDRIYNAQLERIYTECAQWTERLIEVIAQEGPALAIVAVARSHERSIESGEAQWGNVLGDMLREISGAAQATAMIADTPDMMRDVPSCLAEHLSSASACTIPASQARAAPLRRLEQEVAAATATPIVDLIDALCGDVTCPVIVGELLVYRDDDHLTTTYSRELAELLEAQLRLAQLID